MIRKYENSDLTACAQIMMEVYNNELWQCRWSLETAKCYLQDFVNHTKFIGYTLLIDNKVKGAIFAHEKIWWNNSEVFISLLKGINHKAKELIRVVIAQLLLIMHNI